MTDASESAALVLRMKRELMDLVKAAEYASALMACDKLAAVVPRDALVAQYRAVLREKVAMDEANEAVEDEGDGDGEEGSGEEEEGPFYHPGRRGAPRWSNGKFISNKQHSAAHDLLCLRHA